MEPDSRLKRRRDEALHGRRAVSVMYRIAVIAALSALLWLLIMMIAGL